MRKKIVLPRIIKINWIRGFTISVVFNNGESRVIDMKNVLHSLHLDKNTPASLLLQPEELMKVELNNNTLSWNNVEQFVILKNREKVKVPFEIGADVLLRLSFPERSHHPNIGTLIRDSRLKSGLTQQELALRSGTTRNYISRIENDRSDFELGTLKKIVETGLGKQLEIIIK